MQMPKTSISEHEAKSYSFVTVYLYQQVFYGKIKFGAIIYSVDVMVIFNF